MKKILKNLIAPKERKTSKVFAAPTKDQAMTGRFMEAGDEHGVGYCQPVGTFKVSSKGGVPMESVCFPSDLAIR